MRVGPSFSDGVYGQKASSFSGVKLRGLTARPGILWWLLICVLGILAIRLIFLQLINGNEYRLLSDVNKTRTITIPAPRGNFLDRNGIALTTNMVASTSADGIPMKNVRQYPYGEEFSHVIGYVGNVSADDLSDPTFAGYTAQDVVGKSGLESYYENKLRGIDGRKLIEVNAQGQQVRVLGTSDPIAGQALHTTLDEKLQHTAYEAMQGIKKGAVIVSNPKGEILAMVSTPTFDPNLFTTGKLAPTATQSAYTSVNDIVSDNTNQPLLNRAIAGTYPPGSTFKLLVASGALQEGVINSLFTIEDTGILRIGSFSFANWYYTDYGRTEGIINVVRAIARSNDIFFYKLGNLLGVDRISEWAGKFGLGKKTGIDLGGEVSGFVPTKEWKKTKLHEDWYTGDDYHYGIGQGFLLVTPLQVNMYTQAIANGGTLYQPHLLKDQKPNIISQNLLTSDNFNLIREGMIEACSTGGVAWPLFNYRVKGKGDSIKVDGEDFYTLSASESASPDDVGVRVACKTGTAEHGSPTDLPHAWITVFAPAYHPQIIITVLAESSGEGSNVAGPIAKQILDTWFSQ